MMWLFVFYDIVTKFWIGGGCNTLRQPGASHAFHFLLKLSNLIFTTFSGIFGAFFLFIVGNVFSQVERDWEKKMKIVCFILSGWCCHACVTLFGLPSTSWPFFVFFIFQTWPRIHHLPLTPMRAVERSSGGVLVNLWLIIWLVGMLTVLEMATLLSQTLPRKCQSLLPRNCNAFFLSEGEILGIFIYLFSSLTDFLCPEVCCLHNLWVPLHFLYPPRGASAVDKTTDVMFSSGLFLLFFSIFFLPRFPTDFERLTACHGTSSLGHSWRWNLVAGRLKLPSLLFFFFSACVHFVPPPVHGQTTFRGPSLAAGAPGSGANGPRRDLAEETQHLTYCARPP